MRNVSDLTVRGTPRKRAYVAKRAAKDTPIADRLLMHVEVVPSGCWQWQLALTPQTGYASLTINYKRHLAHRLSYETFVGPIPDGLHIDHLCRNRGCINPAHLEPVTCQTNVLRGESSGAQALRRSLCQHGHPYADHGVIRHGRRVCRVCRIAYCRIYISMTRDEREERRSAGLPIVDLAAYFQSSGAA